MSFSPAIIDDLREFVALVDDLRNSNFGLRVLSADEISYQTTSGGQSEFVNFDEDECRSFILGCRLLIQNNERISIGRIWTIFKNQTDEQNWFLRINPPRWMLNDYLDTNAMLPAPGGREITNRVILDTFLYGSYAHLNPEHRARFKRWERDTRQFPFAKLMFLLVLQVLLKTSSQMSLAISDLLAERSVI